MLKKGLGRGLDSLIPKKVNASNYSDFKLNDGDSLTISNENQIIMVRPEEIVANPYQPRKNFEPIALNDLINSIKEYGIIQPLVVSRKNDKYELIAGERRLRSALELNLREVPVIVRQVSEQKKLELALIENLQRENLNPIESAVAYNQLINEFNLTQEDLSKKLSKARSSIANILRFLNLPEEIKDALAKGQISEAHAKYLLGLDSEVKQLAVFKKIIYNNLSVKETDNLIKNSGGTKKTKILNGGQDAVYQDRLQKIFNTKVEIRRNKKGGTVTVFFYSEEDLRELVKKIK
ncbi:chromosome partitioning protein ParB [Candidatus Falkowbacteria bacterium HGW-Falkowbacteria-1]|uniref:Chromosome partitioning protein ParB n=1 Tax=Candidatus Falkowbacteria bacterium HGW-Falkowbacteria-1 TaxID=2013768 RepID=A0A2N2E9T5_9BACT|nr:MAG: chromosome partitioning protein ParB [Candidatus Falkowbacteria bacterium HGW-Falkowbacteria-1]